jgi:hypothetical protein
MQWEFSDAALRQQWNGGGSHSESKRHRHPMKFTAADNMRAALPSGCYNVNQADHQPFVEDAAGDLSPDGSSDIGYRGFLDNITGNLVNFTTLTTMRLKRGMRTTPYINQINLLQPRNPMVMSRVTR